VLARGKINLSHFILGGAVEEQVKKWLRSGKEFSVAGEISPPAKNNVQLEFS